jgi:hypothetical protein
MADTSSRENKIFRDVNRSRKPANRSAASNNGDARNPVQGASGMPARAGMPATVGILENNSIKNCRDVVSPIVGVLRLRSSDILIVFPNIGILSEMPTYEE